MNTIINHLAFNQHASHLSCATNNGFVIYSINPSLQKKIVMDKNGGVGIMNILKKTNIYVLSGSNLIGDSFNYNGTTTSKNVLIVWDHKDNKGLIRIDFSEPIKNLLIHHKDKIVVCVKDKIHIFASFTGKLLAERETFNNPNGIACISNTDDLKIVTLGNRKGEIIIWNFDINESEKVIQAHDNNIECLAINKNGNLVATSSELGTLIRIFDINIGNKLFEFRRGTQPSKISSLAFSYDDKYLACCSTRNGTVHLFDMSDTERNTHSKLVGLKDYLPGWVGSCWSFKQHYLGTFSKCVCDFDDKGILHVASYDGNYYKVSGVNYDNISMSGLYVDTKKIEN